MSFDRKALLETTMKAAIVGFFGSLPVSIAFTQISLGIAWAALIIGTLAFRRPVWGRSPLDPGILAFLGACLLATAFSPHPLESLMGMKKFYLVSAAYMVGFGVSTWERIGRLSALLIFMTVLTSVYGLSVVVFGGQWTLLGTQTMALTASGIIMMVSLLSLALAAGLAGRASRIWASAATSILVASLVFTKSLSSWLGWLAGGWLLFLLFGRWRWAIFTAVAGLAVISSIYLAPSRLFYNYDFREYKSWSWRVRMTIWRTGWEMIKDRPLTGHGLVDLNEIYADKRSQISDAPVADTRSFGHLHNNFLQVAAIGGVVGLAAFCYMLARVFMFLRSLWARSEPRARPYLAGIAAAATAFVVNGMAEWNYGDSEVMTIFWALVGLGMAIGRGERSDSP